MPWLPRDPREPDGGSKRQAEPLEGARRIAYDDQFGQDDGVEATLAAEEEG